MPPNWEVAKAFSIIWKETDNKSLTFKTLNIACPEESVLRPRWLF